MNEKAIGRKAGKVIECPRCGSQELWKHGKNSAGTRQWLCCTCRRVFVVDPYIPSTIKTIADRLILEPVPVPLIAKVLRGFVSRRWLYSRKGSLNV